MRCFVAVDLNTELKQKVLELQKELAGLDTKLVEPENLHFTLKFLGEVDEWIVNRVKGILKELVSGQNRFEIEITGTGVFPNEKFIRVVWVGAPKLTNLQAATDNVLAELFKKEKPKQHDAKRQSVVHLTIARVRSQNHKEDIMGFVKRHERTEIGKMAVREIKLKKSTVTNKGPIYEDLEIYELGVNSSG